MNLLDTAAACDFAPGDRVVDGAGRRAIIVCGPRGSFYTVRVIEATAAGIGGSYESSWRAGRFSLQI